MTVLAIVLLVASGVLLALGIVYWEVGFSFGAFLCAFLAIGVGFGALGEKP